MDKTGNAMDKTGNAMDKTGSNKYLELALFFPLLGPLIEPRSTDQRC